MIRISKLGLCAVIVGALALSASVAQAQDAKKGKAIYSSKGCGACHTINKAGAKMAGPDLGGVTQRRSADWLTRWLKDPGAMFGHDSTADLHQVDQVFRYFRFISRKRRARSEHQSHRR